MTDLRKILTAVVLSAAVAGESPAATIEGRIVSERIENLENFVVYVKQADARFFTPPKEPVKNLQRDYRFVTRVMPIVRGTGVVFASDDPGSHNIHTFATEPVYFDFTLSRGEEYGPVTFDKEGEVMLLCNMHAQMKGFILVLQNPYFTKTDRDGAFIIEGVPPGEYDLVTWSEEFKSLSRKIVIERAEKTVKTQFKY